ncbi:DNA recombination-mediator protein A [compost metagenome]
MNICFTGHRPKEFGGWDIDCPENVRIWLNKYIDKLIELRNEVTFISGAAQGIDQWAADIVIEKKKTNPNVKLLMAIPYYNFGHNWPEKAKKHLEEINKQADNVIFVHKGNWEGNNYLLQLRNEWMVDHSQIVLAVWNGSLGGTRNCVMYAIKQNVPIIRYDFLNDNTIKIKTS